MSWKTLILVLAAAFAMSGCIATTAVKSQEGKAYVVDGHIFGTDMYVCDATDGNPECWPVQEENR
jgi:hypothetical protein